MKIDDRNAVPGTAPGGAAEVDAAQASAKARGSSSFARSGGDSVELSGVSRSVHAFAAAQSARVAQLSKSVRNGSYSVNPALISQSLVAETLAGGVEHGAS